MKNIKVNASLLKDINRKKILSLIEDTEQISRVEVKQILGKDGKTVTNITNSLIEDGLLSSIGYSTFTGGRRRELLTINPNFGYLIGIDLGINYIRGIVTDFKYNVLLKEKIPISPDEPQKSLLSKISKTLKFLVQGAKIPKDKLLGIGFVANGFYDRVTGEWILSVNNYDWKNVPIRDYLSAQYDVPIFLEDSTRSMALAEKYFGIAKKSKNYIFLDIGVGVGCGIIQNNRLYRGASNVAGELGHTIIVPNGKVCSCGRKGCLETVSAGWAIIKEIKERIKNGSKTLIYDLCDGDLDKLETDMIVEAFIKGDKLVIDVMDSASEYLSIGIANLINLFNPESIIFGGQFATLGDNYLTTLKDKLKKYTLPISFKNVKIFASSLDNNAAVLGAITLVRDPYFYINIGN